MMKIMVLTDESEGRKEGLRKTRFSSEVGIERRAYFQAENDAVVTLVECFLANPNPNFYQYSFLFSCYSHIDFYLHIYFYLHLHHHSKFDFHSHPCSYTYHCLFSPYPRVIPIFIFIKLIPSYISSTLSLFPSYLTPFPSSHLQFYSYPYCHPNTDFYSYLYSHSHPHFHSNSHLNISFHSRSYSYWHRYCHSKTHSYRHSNSHSHCHPKAEMIRAINYFNMCRN